MKARANAFFLFAALALAGCANPGGVRVLTDDQFNRVPYGMTKEEALRLLGAPVETMKFPATRTESWDYNYWDTWGYPATFSVVFGPDGSVVTKVSRRIDGGDHGGK